jgi:hypothetical protein
MGQLPLAVRESAELLNYGQICPVADAYGEDVSTGDTAIAIAADPYVTGKSTLIRVFFRKLDSDPSFPDYPP